jgi:hypothetical protein
MAGNAFTRSAPPTDAAVANFIPGANATGLSAQYEYGTGINNSWTPGFQNGVSSQMPLRAVRPTVNPTDTTPSPTNTTTSTPPLRQARNDPGAPGGTNGTATQAAGNGTLSDFSGGMSDDAVRALVNQYLTAGGSTGAGGAHPNIDNGQYWVNAYDQWGNANPAYFETRLEQGINDSPGNSGYFASAGNTPSNAASQTPGDPSNPNSPNYQAPQMNNPNGMNNSGPSAAMYNSLIMALMGMLGGNGGNNSNGLQMIPSSPNEGVPPNNQNQVMPTGIVNPQQMSPYSSINYSMNNGYGAFGPSGSLQQQLVGGNNTGGYNGMGGYNLPGMGQNAYSGQNQQMPANNGQPNQMISSSPNINPNLPFRMPSPPNFNQTISSNPNEGVGYGANQMTQNGGGTNYPGMQ